MVIWAIIEAKSFYDALKLYADHPQYNFSLTFKGNTPRLFDGTYYYTPSKYNSWINNYVKIDFDDFPEHCRWDEMHKALHIADTRQLKYMFDPDQLNEISLNNNCGYCVSLSKRDDKLLLIGQTGIIELVVNRYPINHSPNLCATRVYSTYKIEPRT